MIPPSPVTDQISLDIRGAVWNRGVNDGPYDLAFYLDAETPQNRLHQEQVAVAQQSAAGVKFAWPTKGRAGDHNILLVAKTPTQVRHAAQPLRILSAGIRSTRRIDGAWCSFNLPEMAEGTIYDPVLRQMTDAQWRELVRGMHGIGMDIIVIQASVWKHRHNFDGKPHYAHDDFSAKAFYPSSLFAGRMPIEAGDPIEAILSEADRLGMHVLPAVGLFAWFDFTPESAAWHKRVADELWRRATATIPRSTAGT